MKRMLKKLSALALAGAMVLSLGVSALATEPGEPTTIEGEGQTRIIAASGRATGSGTTQGNLPDEVIKIKLPVNAAAGTFNLYFDPHNLIRESNNAMELEGSDSKFADDTLVYFKNKGDTPSFSKTSDSIKVINKSSVPISVSMKATWDKGNGATYKLARTAEELAQLKTKGEAALYLYVAEDHTETTSPVVDTTRGVPTVSGGGLTYPVSATSGTSGKTAADLVYLNKYVKSIKFAYTDAADETDIQNINLGEDNKTPADWQFTFAIANGKSTTPSVSFDNASTAIPGYVSYNTTTGVANAAVTYKATNAPALEVETTNNADGTKSYALKAVNGVVPDPVSVLKIQRGTTGTSPVVAEITFEWDYQAIAANKFALKETVNGTGSTFSTFDINTTSLKFNSGSGAKVDTDLNRIDGAYILGKDDAGNFARVFAEGFSAEDTDDDKFESVSFNLTAAITDGDVCAKAWDTAFTTSQTGSLSLFWAATPCPDFDPVVKVKSALTSATGSATLDVDWGVGAKKTTTISKAEYTLPGATESTELPSANIAISGKTVTITSVAGLFNAAASGNNAGANGVITLTFKHADTGYTTKVTVNLKQVSA